MREHVCIKILSTAFVVLAVVNRLALHHAQSIILLRSIQMSTISKSTKYRPWNSLKALVTRALRRQLNPFGHADSRCPYVTSAETIEAPLTDVRTVDIYDSKVCYSLPRPSNRLPSPAIFIAALNYTLRA